MRCSGGIDSLKLADILLHLMDAHPDRDVARFLGVLVVKGNEGGVRLQKPSPFVCIVCVYIHTTCVLYLHMRIHMTIAGFSVVYCTAQHVVYSTVHNTWYDTQRKIVVLR